MPIIDYGDMHDGPIGYEGALATIEPHNIRTGFNFSTTVIIPYGRAVVKGGTADDHIALPSASGQVFLGVAYAVELEKRPGYSIDADGNAGIPAQYEGSYWSRGTGFVWVTETVAIGDPVYFIHTPGAGEKVGQFKKTATGATLIPNARWTKSRTGPGVAAVAIDLP